MKRYKTIIVFLSVLILGCSASLIINKGDGNEFEADVKSEPKTKIDSLSILSKNKNDKNQ